MRTVFKLKKGDVVCAYLPNVYETAVAMLATSSFGGVWSSTSTDFGPSGVLDRFHQISPKVLLVTDAISYKRKIYSLVGNINEIVEGLPSLEKVVVIRRHNETTELPIDNFTTKEKIVHWKDLIVETNLSISFTPCSFDHPLFILFSSGTTGMLFHPFHETSYKN